MANESRHIRFIKIFISDINKMALLLCSSTWHPQRPPSFCHWLEPGGRRQMTEITTFHVSSMEGGIEKPWLKVVSEYRTKKRGRGSRRAGKIRRCPHSTNSLTWRSHQTQIKGWPRAERYAGMIGDHICPPLLSPWPPARSGSLGWAHIYKN